MNSGPFYVRGRGNYILLSTAERIFPFEILFVFFRKYFYNENDKTFYGDLITIIKKRSAFISVFGERRQNKSCGHKGSKQRLQWKYSVINIMGF